MCIKYSNKESIEWYVFEKMTFSNFVKICGSSKQRLGETTVGARRPFLDKQYRSISVQ